MNEAQITSQLIEIFKATPQIQSVQDFIDVLDSADIPIEDAMSSIVLILKGLLGGGRSATFTEPYNVEEVKLGLEVEQEHISGINNKVILNLIALKIVKDHLAEDPEYYTKLATLGL